MTENIELSSHERMCSSCEHQSYGPTDVGYKDLCTLLLKYGHDMLMEEARSSTGPCGPFGVLFERDCVNHISSGR